MARPLRIEYPGAWYHAMNRGASYSRIFNQPEDYALFLKVIEEACLLFNVYISSYCLMSSHYHLLLCTPEGNISRFMRHLNGVYTQRFNRKYKKDGALFRGRYKAILIQADEYLTQVVKYIHKNPVKSKTVKSEDDYRWSSHRIYLSGKCNKKWMDISSVLLLFSEKRRSAIRLYREFMGSQLDEEVKSFYSKKNQSSILGEQSFREWIKMNFISIDNKAKIEVKEKRQVYGERIIKEINCQVSKAFDVDENSLFLQTRGKENLPRFFAVSLSREISGLSLIEIAEKYKSLSYKTISSNQFRFKKKMEKSKKLARLYKKIKNTCSHAEI